MVQHNGITTKQVTELTSLTRRLLETSPVAEVCEPRRTGEGRTSKRLWSIEQMYMATRIRELQEGGMSADDVLNLASQGSKALSAELQCLHAGKARLARRKFKAQTSYLRMLSDMERLGNPEGWYLRYLPQRWLALAPAAKNPQSRSSKRNAPLVPGTSWRYTRPWRTTHS